MREVTPPPGVSKADWLAEHGTFALIAGAIAAAAPFLRAQALGDAADALEADASDSSYRDSEEVTQGQLDAAEWLRARAATERGQG